MGTKFARNTVIFKPTVADSWCQFNLEKLAADDFNGESYMTFEQKGNRIEIFESVQHVPSLTLETEYLTGTTTLSLVDNTSVVIISEKLTMAHFFCGKLLPSYSTIPQNSGFTKDLKIRFELANKSIFFGIKHYKIIDEQSKECLGILLVPGAHGSETFYLAFEKAVTESQKQIIVGVSAFIISDFFRIGNLAKKMTFYGYGLTLLVFIIYVVVLILWKSA